MSDTAARVAALLDRSIAALSAGRLAEAESGLTEVLALDPRQPDGVHFFGMWLAASGQPEQGIAWIKRSLDLLPGDLMFLGNYASLLLRTNQAEIAIAVLEQAIGLGATEVAFFANLGRARLAIGDSPQALAAFEKAIGLGAVPAWLLDDAAELAAMAGRPGLADDCLRRRLAEFGPGARTFHQLGNVMRDLARRDDAIDAWARALAQDPDDFASRQNLIYMLQYLAEWEALGSVAAATCAGIVAATPLTVGPASLLALSDDAELNRACSVQWAKRLDPAAARPCAAAPRGSRLRIRLAYLSNDYSNHATTQLLTRIIELHDRAGFEVHAYSWSPDDGSAMRRRTIDAFDRFVEVGGMSDAEVASRLREDGIDIAIDLKGYTQGARPGIFAHRAAPVQINYLGYPGTSGAPWIDYLIADAWLVPQELRSAYSEALILLPDCYQPNDDHRPRPAAAARATFGVDESTLVFACLNQSYKITAPVFERWMSILKRVPDSVLLILVDFTELESRLRRRAESQGVSADRLRFLGRAPYVEYLAALGACDLFLDTFPYNAHTTASDALWMGTPVLTCAGKSFAARVAGSMLATSGLAELIAGNFAEYEEKAVRLAADRETLRGLRERIVTSRAGNPLFASAAYVRAFERGLRQAWDQYLSGAAASDIRVAPTA